MDYQKAIQNLTDILIDEEKFSEINKSIFDAIDTDNSGSLERDEVETFVKGLLKGIHSGSEDNSLDLQERHKIVFSVPYSECWTTTNPERSLSTNSANSCASFSRTRLRSSKKVSRSRSTLAR